MSPTVAMGLRLCRHVAGTKRKPKLASTDIPKPNVLTQTGIEPATFCSEDRCSTFEPRDRNRGMQVIAIRMEMEILA